MCIFVQSAFRYCTCTIFGMLMLLMAASSAKTEEPIELIGPSSWRVSFSPETENLVAHHQETGAHIEGVLAFVVYRDGGEQSWSIVGPRDPVRNRLSLLDERGNVQGYLTFGGSGDLLEIAVIHRSAQNYDGELAFVGQASLAAKTFACRTVPPSENAVLQMASGLVDSGLNDSLFDLKEDVALRFASEALSITTAAQQGGRPLFEVKMKADPAEPRHWVSSLAFGRSPLAREIMHSTRPTKNGSSITLMAVPWKTGQGFTY